MGNQEELTTVEVVTIEGEVKQSDLQVSQPIITQEVSKRIENRFEVLKSSKLEKGLSLSPKYLEFEKVGDTIKAVFIGFQVIEKEDKGKMKKLNCAVFADVNKEVYMNAGTTFFNACLNFNPGDLFEATLVEFKASTKGKVKVFKIHQLFESE
jgi:hypothetical protein